MHMIGVCMRMRMPLFSYFVAMGLTLTLALLYISDHIEPLGSPIPTSPIGGMTRQFTPEPERSPYAITATNFAAPYGLAEAAYARGRGVPKTARQIEPELHEQKTAGTEAIRVPGWKHVAQNPIAALMNIH
jgi:hypothetical protein